MPYFCPIFGPYPVEGKNSEHLGELKPHCYICHSCPWNWWWPCCTSLSVFDGKMAEAYVVKRECCTCYCCTRWNVYDQMQNIKAEIKQVGWFCPNYEITLPEDHPKTKLLVLSTVHMLPWFIHQYHLLFFFNQLFWDYSCWHWYQLCRLMINKMWIYYNIVRNIVTAGVLMAKAVRVAWSLKKVRWK